MLETAPIPLTKRTPTKKKPVRTTASRMKKDLVKILPSSF